MTWHPKIENLFWQVLSKILIVSIHCKVKSTMLNNTIIINIYVYFYYLLIMTLILS